MDLGKKRYGSARTYTAKRGSSRAGITFIEVMVSFTVFMVAVLFFSRVIVSSMVASEVNHEVTVATEAGRRMIETLQATDFSDAFALYNTSTADDPLGPGTAPGKDFAVEGLQPAEDDVDGMVGEIELPNLPAAPGVLREDLNAKAFGLPRDLDGDGQIDALDHSDDYRLLPVLVRLRWRGKSGSTEITFRTQLGNFE